MTKQETAIDPAAARLHDLLGYVEQVVRLDEKVALRLGEHRLPTGQAFVLHQHELHALPGVRHDLVDEDGAVWLAVERLRRSDPPAPPEPLADWLEMGPDPDRQPKLREFLIRTLPGDAKDALVSDGLARPEDCAEALRPCENGAGLWDVRLRLEDSPEVRAAAEDWVSKAWLPWSLAERPVRRSLSLYQRLFEVAQLAELGGDRPFELVWGIGLARWRREDREIDLPLVERLVEIEIDDVGGAEIRIRPRSAGATVNLRAFEEVGVDGVTLAQDAARRSLAIIDPEEGISPYRRESFEPILRACQARLDVEGAYLPDHPALAPDRPPPAAEETLAVSDRWAIFARRRSDSFLLADIENLKRSVERTAQEHELGGPARTLVMGPPAVAARDIWKPLSDRVGGTAAGVPEPDVSAEDGDYFFGYPDFGVEQRVSSAPCTGLSRLVPGRPIGRATSPGRRRRPGRRTAYPADRAACRGPGPGASSGCGRRTPRAAASIPRWRSAHPSARCGSTAMGQLRSFHRPETTSCANSSRTSLMPYAAARPRRAISAADAQASGTGCAMLPMLVE